VQRVAYEIVAQRTDRTVQTARPVLADRACASERRERAFGQSLERRHETRLHVIEVSVEAFAADARGGGDRSYAERGVPVPRRQQRHRIQNARALNLPGVAARGNGRRDQRAE
jgi:hypothetical protein